MLCILFFIYFVVFLICLYKIKLLFEGEKGEREGNFFYYYILNQVKSNFL